MTHADEEPEASCIGFPYLQCTFVSSGSERISFHPPTLACGIVIGYYNKRGGTAESGALPSACPDVSSFFYSNADFKWNLLTVRTMTVCVVSLSKSWMKTMRSGLIISLKTASLAAVSRLDVAGCCDLLNVNVNHLTSENSSSHPLSAPLNPSQVILTAFMAFVFRFCE